MLPAEARLPDVMRLIERQEYWALHAARQTGKTTAMRSLAERLRGLGYAAVWATLEEARDVTSVDEAEPLWIEAITEGLRRLPLLPQPPPALLPGGAVGRRLHVWLQTVSALLPTASLVLLLDEADVVTGPALISLLAQLRAGFMDHGPGHFPSSIALIGMRDLHDYLMESKGGKPVSPGSPFNIKRASLTLRNFTKGEVATLYSQHTEDTGQVFTKEAIERAFYWSGGQPFLVNALAGTCVDDLMEDRSVPIDGSHMDEAKERLILSRTTHLRSLTHRLKDPRVAAIVEAVIGGDDARSIPYGSDDFEFVVDLGLIRQGPMGAEAANPIYREVLGRQLSYDLQSSLVDPSWRWLRPDGRLDFPTLIDAFLAFWRENADVLRERDGGYKEIVPHLTLMGFLQRVVNGGGRVNREFAAGRGALDLLVEYGPDRFVVEVKRLRAEDKVDTVKKRGIAQISAYLDTVGCKEGWLLIFDVRPNRTWRQRLWKKDVEVGGRTIWIRGG